MDPVDAFAPGASHRLGEQPAAVAFTGEVRDEADEGELALARLAEVELQHAGFAAGLVEHRIKLDARVLDDLGKMSVVEHQAREPQPRRADQAEQLAVMLGLRNFDAVQRERRRGDRLLLRRRAHLEIGDHRRQLAVGQS